MNKLIVIIGAGPGISMATAEKFASEGFKVALLARNPSRLEEMKAQLSSKGYDVVTAQADAADQESLRNALHEIRNNHGHAEVILYNAAAVSVMDILEQSWDRIKSDLDINAGGLFHLMKIVLPYCIQQNKGKIFVTGGGFALAGDDTWISLSVGKAALRNLVQAFQKKVAGSNIHIAQLTVCGYVNPSDPKYNPASIADQYWKLYLQQPDEFENEIIY
ncbi:MAG: SDR family NAD(P)-dependent oxidoreductase [Bacteroidetes bacterium]|nr:SDR family NAD(P)-dependent oxidoreductase [Bacteroidota bacterium]